MIGLLKKINWKVRIKNKVFWMTFIPAVIILIQTIANVFGITLDLSELTARLIKVVEAVFGVLVILGVVVDPTTKGMSDGELGITYTEPM